MASISVNLLTGFKPSSVVKHVLAISHSSDRSFAPLRNIFAASKVVEPEWLSAALANLTPLKEAANTIDFLLPSTQEGSPFVKFVVSVLPSTFSRGNCPSHAHIVSSVVKANKGPGDVVIVVSSNDATAAFAQACAASRPFPLFNMKSGQSTVVTNVDIVIDTAAAISEAELSAIRSNVENIRLAQRLVDMPPNLLHVDSYITEARVVAEKVGASILVIQGKDLETQGFGGLFGVGKASEHPPALVVLSHYPHGTTKDTPSVCLVGKGIVYDTGGLSIKTPTAGMCGMKMDMGGSAAVLGGFAAAVTAGTLTAPLHALLCIAENSVDERSIRPDDILTMLSGKTVEVNNTDAEGRLVLADGVHYAGKFLKPRVIIDIATLTGAQLIATGKKHAALFSNDEDLETLAVQVGKDTGDLTFPLVYAPEFHKNEFRSQVADMKNSVADRGNAQSSCAGQFIANHLEDYFAAGGKWMHVDCAGPAFAEDRATGYGVALLSQLTQRLNNNFR